MVKFTFLFRLKDTFRLCNLLKKYQYPVNFFPSNMCLTTHEATVCLLYIFDSSCSTYYLLLILLFQLNIESGLHSIWQYNAYPRSDFGHCISWHLCMLVWRTVSTLKNDYLQTACQLFVCKVAGVHTLHKHVSLSCLDYCVITFAFWLDPQGTL